MRKILAALAVLAVAAAPASSLAATSKKKNHNFTETALGATIVPAAGAPVLILQTKSSLAGPGAATFTVIPGATTGTVLGVDYHSQGSIKSTVQFKFGATAPDGSAPVSGTGKITSGTGRYKGAKGAYTFTGVQDKQAVYTITLTGSIRY